MRTESPNVLRRMMLALLLLGLLGTATELVLLRHYESITMWVPLVVIFLAVVATLARLARPAPSSVRWLRLSMLPLLVAGVLGAYFHYRGGLEFQVDMDPTLTRWQLALKVLHMQAPPTLAPGVLVQFALLGFASTYRDPLLERQSLPAVTGVR